jgi:hypothetical protein
LKKRLNRLHLKDRVSIWDLIQIRSFKVENLIMTSKPSSNKITKTLKTKGKRASSLTITS